MHRALAPGLGRECAFPLIHAALALGTDSGIRPLAARRTRLPPGLRVHGRDPGRDVDISRPLVERPRPFEDRDRPVPVPRLMGQGRDRTSCGVSSRSATRPRGLRRSGARLGRYLLRPPVPTEHPVDVRRQLRRGPCDDGALRRHRSVPLSPHRRRGTRDRLFTRGSRADVRRGDRGRPRRSRGRVAHATARGGGRSDECGDLVRGDLRALRCSRLCAHRRPGSVDDARPAHPARRP